MKKTLIALASVAALGAAHADVTLYGRLDANVTSSNHSVPADPNAGFSVTPLPAAKNAIASNQVTAMGSGGLGTSMWGIMGNDKESGAMFKLEAPVNVPFGTNANGRISNATYTGVPSTSPYAPQEGSSDGQMFSREATVGIAGSMGVLKLGRQTTIAADALGNYDVLGPSVFSPLTFNGGYAGGGFTAEARWDQAIKYQYNIMPNIRLDVGYKFGGSSATFSQGSAFGIGANIAVTPTLEIYTGYLSNKDAQNANAGTAVAGSLTEKITFGDTHAGLFAINWTANSTMRVKAGYEQIVTQQPSNPVYDQTINVLSGVAVNAWDVTAYQVPRTENMYWVGFSWDFAPKWTANLGLYERDTSTYGTSAAQATGCSALAAGTTATICQTSKAQYQALTVTNDLSKMTTVYFGLATNSLSGPAWGTSSATQILPVTSEMVGLRMKF